MESCAEFALCTTKPSFLVLSQNLKSFILIELRVMLATGSVFEVSTWRSGFSVKFTIPVRMVYTNSTFN